MDSYNSWHAFLKAQEVPAEMLPSYEEIFPVEDDGRHAATISSNLTAEDHLVIMLRSESGKIKLLHHFKFDAVSPLRPRASNQLWAIMGHAHGQGVPVALARDPWDITTDLVVPSFDALSQARSASEVEALEGEDEVTLDYVNAMALPPFMASAMMGAKTEDPGELCVVACKAIRDFDIALRDPTGINGET
jgi:hypothetical protein